MITLIKESNIMGKLLKYSFYLIIIILLFLIGYSFFGDLSAPQEIITEKIQMPNDTWIYSFNKMSKNNKLIDNFLETIHAERNASKNTLLAYKRDLEAFTRFLSKKRITISTSGLIPQINKLADRTDVSLAISLHAADDALRDIIVPINQKYPIDNLLDACKNYLSAQKDNRHITIEYILIDGINDSLSHARSLSKILTIIWKLRL